MNIWKWSHILAAVPCIGLVGCSQVSAQEQALISQLRAAGATVEQTDAGGQWPLSGTQQTLKVNGEVVEVYAYESHSRPMPRQPVFRQMG
jgi:hypothetical protein